MGLKVKSNKHNACDDILKFYVEKLIDKSPINHSTNMQSFKGLVKIVKTLSLKIHVRKSIEI